MDERAWNKLIENARRIQSERQEIIDKMDGQVHFRPGTGGISMISLLANNP